MKSRSFLAGGTSAPAALFLLVVCAGCTSQRISVNNARADASGTGGSGGSTTPPPTGGAPREAGFVFNVPDGGPPPVVGTGTKPCDNLCLKQMQCPGGGDTTISGTVYAPTPPAFGAPDPLYNALVYVPNAPVKPFTDGVTCDVCTAQASGSPLVIDATGPDGKFILHNAPVADNLPLVVQIGRWRRQVVIPKITACADNPLPAELTRLPRNKAEGDIPRIAISTGKVDALECLLRKVGVDNSEFTLPSGDGRVHLFLGNGSNMGPTTPPETALTGSLDTLKRYDIAILECQGNPYFKPMADKQNVIDYTSAGGRLFTTHYSYVWLYDIAPFMGVAAWTANGPHPTPLDTIPLTGTVDQTFPKGMAFAQWLEVVKATSPMPGQIQINVPRHDLDATIAPAQTWINSAAPQTVQHFTFNTPVGVAEDKQCGRVLFSDFHVSHVDDASLFAFPMECTDTPLTPQEKVLEFMLFDLSSCVQPDSQPPIIP
jgi:hypothetical protein